MHHVLLIVALTISLLSPAGAVGKHTIDPNAGHANAAAVHSDDLAQAVTYQAKHQAVLSILADLSKITGVTLKAGYSNSDWQVRDRRMNVFARAVPLASLMDSIARVMRFQWIKHENDVGVVSYRLCMDRKALEDAEQRRATEEKRLKQHKSEALNKLFSGLESAARMSDAQLDDLKTQSPFIYSEVKNGNAGLVSALYAGVPAAKQALSTGDELILSAAALSPTTKQAVAQFLRRQFSQSFGTSGAEQFLQELDQASITINKYEASPHYTRGDWFIGSVRIDLPGAMNTGCALLDPDSAYAKANGSAFVQIQSASTPEERRIVARNSAQSVYDAIAADAKDVGEQPIEHPDDPALNVKVKMKTARCLDDELSALADSSDFAIVSDTFDRQLRFLNLPDGPVAVRSILDQVQSAYHCDWQRHGKTIELQDMDWFRKRAAQIPDAWIQDWRNALKKNGLLEIDKLAQMAMLTREQYLTNIVPDDILGQDSITNLIGYSHDLLCFYAGLDKQQQTAIFADRGLALDSLAVSESAAVKSLLRHCSSFGNGSAGGLRLVGRRTKGGENITYNFSVTASGGSLHGLKWQLSCPTYAPPATSKPKADD